MTVEDTLKERGTKYGDFMELAKLACDLKQQITLAIYKRSKVLDADQLEALDMICVKIARIINGDPNHADNWHDIAGYATLVAARLVADGEK